MRQLTPDIYLIEGLRASNAYLLVAPEGLTLVDAGSANEAEAIHAQLRQAGFSLADLRQVVITHAHNDHTGSAAEIVRQSGARVLAHIDEMVYIGGGASLPFRSRLQRLAFWLSARLMPKTQPVKVGIALIEGEIIPATGGYATVHTPGHTPGSMSLFHPERRILICGDALFNKHPLTRRKGLQEPMRLISVNPDQARDSICKLEDLGPQVLLCGHGDPVLEKAAELIKLVDYTKR
jgi:glyoxylase-like metal-dependent hydrolase (beta-lactamase superfamily II)